MTAHCRLELLGLDFPACSEDCHGESMAGESQENTGGDTCDLVEDRYYKAAVKCVKVPAPIATLGAGLFPLAPGPDADPGLTVAPAEADRPQEWVAQWHFARRAAAPAHAPDSSIA